MVYTHIKGGPAGRAASDLAADNINVELPLCAGALLLAAVTDVGVSQTSSSFESAAGGEEGVAGQCERGSGAGSEVIDREKD